jgi:hypothetical protein
MLPVWCTPAHGMDEAPRTSVRAGIPPLCVCGSRGGRESASACGSQSRPVGGAGDGQPGQGRRGRERSATTYPLKRKATSPLSLDAERTVGICSFPEPAEQAAQHLLRTCTGGLHHRPSARKEGRCSVAGLCVPLLPSRSFLPRQPRAGKSPRTCAPASSQLAQRVLPTTWPPLQYPHTAGSYCSGCPRRSRRLGEWHMDGRGEGLCPAGALPSARRVNPPGLSALMVGAPWL